MKSKWITDLNVTHQTIKVFEKIVGKNLQALELSKQFLDTKRMFHERKK